MHIVRQIDACTVRACSAPRWSEFTVLILVAGASLVPASQPAYAQTAPAEATLDEVIVTGSRRATPSPTDLPSPVTIVPATQLSNQGSNSISELLRTTVPSFDLSEQPISGTATSEKPANLRGLSPDLALVLINGKRLHRGAEIPTFGTALMVGSQGVDLASIPAIALKQVEVLRDGAAAQYGSDAIAGVINFILDDDPNRVQIDAKRGQYFQGDGATDTVDGTFGVPLGNKGFFRLSGEFSNSDPTDRARTAYLSDIQTLVNDGITEAAKQQPVWGSPRLQGNLKLFANMATEVGGSATLYGFGSYAQRTMTEGFFYRSPFSDNGVSTINGNRLVGDLTPNHTGNCPGTVAGGGLVPAGTPADQALLAQVAADPNCFTWANIFPGGYTPQFGSKVTDSAGTIGLRGKSAGGMSWDVSAGYGRNEETFNIFNDTIASLPTLATKLDPITSISDLGSRTQEEIVLNLDVAKDYELGLHSPLTVAAGLEWHQEQWIAGVGQPESYSQGPLYNQGFTAGATGYFGYGPVSAGSFKRHNSAVYLDTEADVTQSLVLGAAARYEDFSDLGGQVVGKLSGLVHITNSLGVRATVSTGFHAPTPAQQHIVYSVDQGTSSSQLTLSGIIPASNPVSRQFGGRPAVPETSVNFSTGLVFDGMLFDSQPIKVTLDTYLIEVKHRISLSGTFNLDDAQRQELADSGLLQARSFTSIQFFTNDFATKTEGADLVVSMPFKLGNGASNLTLAANWNETNVTNRTSITSDSEVFSLENGLPKTRANLTFDHAIERWRGLVRANYYSNSVSQTFGFFNTPTGSATTVDVEGGFKIAKNFEISAGGQNIFNKLPTDVSNYPFSGVIGTRYAPETPWGFNGALWYARATYRFQ